MMASEYDYETSFTFRKPNGFYKHLNKQMVIQDRDSLNDDSLYHLLLFSSAPLDFNECIDENGCLKTNDAPTSMIKIEPSVSTYTDVQFHLGVEWFDNGESGFSLFLDEWETGGTAENHTQKDVNIEFAEDEVFYIKAIALAKVTGADTGSDYIVAYARQLTEVRVQNYLTLMKGSAFVGQDTCEVQ